MGWREGSGVGWGGGVRGWSGGNATVVETASFFSHLPQSFFFVCLCDTVGQDDARAVSLLSVKDLGVGQPFAELINSSTFRFKKACGWVGWLGSGQNTLSCTTTLTMLSRMRLCAHH